MVKFLISSSPPSHNLRPSPVLVWSNPSSATFLNHKEKFFPGRRLSCIHGYKRRKTKGRAKQKHIITYPKCKEFPRPKPEKGLTHHPWHHHGVLGQGLKLSAHVRLLTILGRSGVAATSLQSLLRR